MNDNIKLYLFRIKKLIEGSIAVDFSTQYNEYERKIIDELECCTFRIKLGYSEANDSSDFIKSNTDYKSKLFGIILGLLDGTIDSKVKLSKDISKEQEFKSNIQSLYEKINNNSKDLNTNLFDTNSLQYILNMPELLINGPYSKFINYYNYGYKHSNKVDIINIYDICNILLNDILNKKESIKQYKK